MKTLRYMRLSFLARSLFLLVATIFGFVWVQTTAYAAFSSQVPDYGRPAPAGGEPPGIVENGFESDSDGDGVLDALDNCPLTPNPDQSDLDTDGVGDVCDDCTDADADGWGAEGLNQTGCPLSGDDCNDMPGNTDDPDQDNVCINQGDESDNCPDVFNPDQTDSDGDGVGDACDPSTCGNGMAEPPEACDDFNTSTCGTCSADCSAVQEGGDCPAGTSCLFDQDCLSGTCSFGVCT